MSNIQNHWRSNRAAFEFYEKKLIGFITDGLKKLRSLLIPNKKTVAKHPNILQEIAELDKAGADHASMKQAVKDHL